MTLNSRSRNNLISSTLICLIFMINELVFGILSHSVAMATTPCTFTPLSSQKLKVRKSVNTPVHATIPNHKRLFLSVCKSRDFIFSDLNTSDKKHLGNSMVPKT